MRAQNLSEDDGKRNGVQAARPEVTDGMELSKRNIEEMIRNYRKEVLGIESAIPKIC